MGILKLESEKGCCELWQKTMDLRWYPTSRGVAQLQQRHFNTTNGDDKWVVVDVVKVEKSRNW